MDNDFDLEALIAERDDPMLSAAPVQLLASQQRQLELISHLAAYSELLIAVVGEDGSGKTTLAQALNAQRHSPDDTLFFNASPMFGIPALLQAIARQWQLPSLSDHRASALEQLTEQGQSQYADGGQLLVVIDQAELLDVDTLNDIAHLALLMPQHVAFVLLGRSGFEQSLRSSPAHAPLHAMYLEPLDEQESEELAHNLVRGRLSPEQIQIARTASGGWIGPLLAQLEDMRETMSVQSSVKSKPETTTPPLQAKGRTPRQAQGSSAQKAPFPLTHIVGSAALVAILLLAYVYQRAGNDEVPVVEVALSEEVLTTVERDQALAALLDSAESRDFNFSDEADTAVERRERNGASTTSEMTQPNAIPSVTLPNSVTEAPVAASSERPIATPAAPATPAIAPQPSPVKQPAVAAAVTLPYNGAVLLAERRGYIVQLLGVRDVKAAQQYRERWQGDIAQRLYLYQTVHQGQPWFVVVAGVYDNEATARRAVQQYPAQIRTNSPWVRPITAVHDALR